MSPRALSRVALLIQATGSPQGSLNPTLYRLAARNDLGPIFHDITQENNSVPGFRGYSAGPGWDAVTGLGSIDAAALISNWPASGQPAGPTFTNQRVTTVPPSTSACAVPPSVSSFRTGDNIVYLYFEATVTSNDSLTMGWLGPGGVSLDGGGWDSVSGSYCFTGAALDISNTPDELLGAWQAAVYNNGKLVFTVPFTIGR